MAVSHEVLGHVPPEIQTADNGHLLERVVGRILHRERPPEPPFSLFSERVREKREACEREGYKTYVGNVYLRPEQGSGPGEQDWSFQEATPVFPPNPEPNASHGDHVLRSGDYLIIFDPNNINQVVWEGKIDLYTKGIRDPQGNPWGYMHQRGVDEGDFFEWFNGSYPAELRTSVKPGKFATAEETAGLDNRPQALATAA